MDPRIRELTNQAAAVEAGHRTFDEAVDLLVALGDRQAFNQAPLAGEDAESFRALVALFLRETLRARGTKVRAPTVHEQVAHTWWDALQAQLQGLPPKPKD